MLLLFVLFCMVWLYTLDIQQKEPRIVDDTSPRVRGAHLKPPREASSHTNINAKSPEVRGAPHKLLKPPREASSHININAISPEVRGAPQVLSKPPREASSHTATGPEVRGAPHMLLKPPREASSHIITEILTTSIKKIRINIPWVRGAPEALLQKPFYAAALFISLFIYVAFRSRWHTTPAVPEIASSDTEDPRYREFFATEEEIKFATQQADLPVLPPPPPVLPIKVRRKLHRGQ